jgi:uncharacterized membrane protein (UPF0127 family)
MTTVGAMRSVVLLLLACALVACGDDDTAAPATTAAQATAGISPSTTVRSTTTVLASPPVGASSAPMTTGTATTLPPDAVVPQGFEQAAATVTAADGAVCKLCLWLAETEDQRALGLMYVTDLGGPDGMVFRYDAPTTAAFWMKNTLMPLSIAFFDQRGAYLDGFDMAPCTADPCPNYPTPANFTDAIEVPQGMLDELGMKPGSVLAVSALPCESSGV